MWRTTHSWWQRDCDTVISTSLKPNFYTRSLIILYLPPSSLPFGLTRLYLMFPATTKERGLLLQPSPKYSREANKSTYLPYFKRFPHQKFHSQEKRRHEEQAAVAPRRFFTEEKEQPEPTQQQFSSFAIKERSPGKLRPRTHALTQDSFGSYTNANCIRPNASPSTP